MFGSAAVGSVIAQIAFVVLMLLAAFDGRQRLVVIGVALWVAGYVAATQIASLGLWFTPFVAAVDAVLVFTVMRGDVRLN